MNLEEIMNQLDDAKEQKRQHNAQLFYNVARAYSALLVTIHYDGVYESLGTPSGERWKREPMQIVKGVKVFPQKRYIGARAEVLFTVTSKEANEIKEKLFLGEAKGSIRKGYMIHSWSMKQREDGYVEVVMSRF